MDKIPFTIYDFFGYLASGFMLLASLDITFRGSALLNSSIAIPRAIFWVVLSYLVGHLIANFSGFVFERKLVRGWLGSPEQNLFGVGSSALSRLFPGYYDQLPAEILAEVLKKAGARGYGTPGRGMFFHCHSVVKRESAILGRLNTFLNLYGFCRNMALSSLLCAFVFFAGIIAGFQSWNPFVLWVLGALCASIGMVYRYLKFFRLYTFEVFVSYAEIEVTR